MRKQTFDAVLDIPAGRIHLVAADRTDATVEILPADPATSRDVQAAERLAVTRADGVLRIEAAKPANRLLGSPGAVEVTVQLPAGSRVQAKVAAGELRGAGRLGDVTVDSAQGSIELEEAGSAQLTLQAGDIVVGRLTGSAQLSTQKGDLRVAEAVAPEGSLTLRTQDGDITVGARTASLDASTAYGRIDNSLTGSGLTIHATTSRGDITARGI
ncbi:DUF4097 family beta strand repeat-containing protein [Actinoplanes sp. RD1]|uniref:DUF4097 family beta strand repeat-containing protein n=1 Tax=Actinoplanes sp. RD1 TaxID=3064538 RepID=UPI00274093CD|nr:DUF4097 family beta strand repeat-containing protein [Actinoplanes sp. RD1]